MKALTLKTLLGFFCLFLLAACTPESASVVDLPTLVQLPTTDAASTATSSATATEAQRVGPPTLPATFTPLPTQTNAATFTFVPTITSTATLAPTVTSLTFGVEPEGTPFQTSTFGEFWLEAGGDFSRIGAGGGDGRYLVSAVGIEGVSELLLSTSMQLNSERIYGVYFRVRFPSDLAAGTYSLQSEREFDPAETVTAIFWYTGCTCDNEDIVLDQNLSGSIRFTTTGNEVNAIFSYTASDGSDTISLTGRVDNARSD
jgi:hypothetical protein